MYEKPVVDNMNPTRASTLGTETWFDMYYIVWGANVAVGVTAVGAYELSSSLLPQHFPSASKVAKTSNES